MKTKCFNNFNQKIKKEKKNFPKKYMGHTSNTFGNKQLELYKEKLYGQSRILLIKKL